ncbi:alcohol dehydrogenase catalytic domain-containing protein [Micromonospora sp. DT53]|uniref:alcohol dehydrogenase catalytic domain-containing protein n=1 Tax=Micromonospora sp. DT53 TaxID=3393444 RepID=UPI003CE6D3A7
MSDYGDPDVLSLSTVAVPEPGPGQIRVAVRFAGVGPTDLAIRAGHLRHVFKLADPAILGFEAAGVVDAVGVGVRDVAAGDEVAVSLPGLGGYAEYVVASYWVRKPAGVSWEHAAALPASGEAAVRSLRLLGVTAGETLLILGGTGAVGTIATQLAVAAGVNVVAAVRGADFAAAKQLGATPIDYARPLGESVAAVDAVLDASGHSDLEAAVRLAGGTDRVITLSDPHGPQIGVVLSSAIPDGINSALAEAMAALAEGRLTLRPQIVRPLAEVASVHAGLADGALRTKVVLAV